MAKLSASRRRGLLGMTAATLALAAILAAARSPRARAAYVAFRDPTRVHEDSPSTGDGAPPPAPMELEMPEPPGDFERVSEDALADAGEGTLAGLMLPDFPIPVSRRTMRFVGYFAARDKGRQAFAERFRRAGRYRTYIEQALRDAELPEDLVWLVAIESGFNPQAVSPKGAAGLFQFMPETGDRYGLSRSELVDERLSITRSTRAGVTHLRDLFDRYRQWDLALAAYNFGPERLDEALARLAERRGPRGAGKSIELKDLVEARLVPGETASFVPQIQAFAIVAANRGRFGLDDLDPVPPLEIGEIAVPGGTPLRLVSRAAGVSIAVLREYNPDLLRDQAPPGGDAIVNLPADRVATTLAAFPALLARETSRLAAATASAAPMLAERGAPEPAPERTATPAVAAPPKPVEPPPDRWTSTSGVVIERRASVAPDVTVAARVEILDPGHPPRPSGRVFDVAPITMRPAELGAGLERASRGLRLLAVDAGQAAVEARRRAGEARRRTLEKAPYGPSWLALGDHLFAPGTPLAGTVLVAPTLPPNSVVFAEQPRRGGLAFTVTLAGAVDRAAAGSLAERAFADVLGPGAALTAHPREERVTVTEPVPSARVIFGWLAPSTGDDGAGLRLALLSLAHHELGRAARALVVERHVAAHVRGMLDHGDRADVVAIEAMPAVLHDVGEVERALDKAIDGFAEHGPSAVELAANKAQLQSRIQAERARAGSNYEPKDAALARLQRISERVEAITGEELQALVKKVFAPGHRVVVTTVPRG